MKNYILIFLLVGSPLQFLSQFEEAINVTGLVENTEEIHSIDIDNDGDLDFVITNFSQIVWYENLGDSNFSEQQVIHDNNELWITGQLEIVDFDSDGDNDIFFTSGPFEHTISFLKNLGNGEFDSPVVCHVAMEGIYYLESGDLNNDGLPELIFCFSGLDIKIAYYMLNNGDWALGEPVEIYNMGEEWGAIGNLNITDINNDGFNDVVYTIYGATGKLVWHENINGEYLEGQEIIYEGDAQPDIFKTADFDSDGDFDIAVSFDIGTKLYWYQNDGEGSFTLAQMISTADLDTRSLDVGDIDNDGDLDIVAGNYIGDSYNTLLFFNNGSGIFSAGEPVTTTIYTTYPVKLSDINDDGYLDLFALNHVTYSFLWIPNDGSGNFLDKIFLDILLDGRKCATSGDIDGDGDIDVLSTSEDSGTVGWFANDGNNDFGPLRLIFHESFPTIRKIGLEDFDNDGDLDVLYNHQYDGLLICKNNGVGEFSDPEFLCPNYNTLNYAEYQDINGDTYADAIFQTGSQTIGRRLNDGTGSLGTVSTIISNLGDVDFTLLDVTQNGEIDLLIANEDTGEIFFNANTGFGTFGTSQTLLTSTGPLNPKMADFNSDGILDLIYISSVSGTHNILINLGQGDLTFGDPILVESTGFEITHLEITDINQDGYLDIIRSTCSDGIKCTFNNGLGEFNDPAQLINGDCIHYFELTDINYDGVDDLLLENSSGKSIQVMINISGQGCTNSLACNFDPDAIIDNDSCCIGTCGCTDPVAVNYNIEADCEAGSCLYNFSGVVFYDENANGIQDDSEPGLSSHQVSLISTSLSSFSDAFGTFSFSEIPIGTYSLEVNSSESYPYPTSPGVIDLIIDGSQDLSDLSFGLTSFAPNYELDVYLNADPLFYSCEYMTVHNITIQNQSTVTLDVHIDLDVDELFTSYQEISSIESIDENVFSFFEENVQPGEFRQIIILLETPNEESLGETLLSNVLASGSFDDVNLVNTNDSISVLLACAYDPNDKQSTPVGFQEEHYILTDTELEFRIRFQNTGNAPAIDVKIKDTIDTKFNLESLEILNFSHNMEASVNQETREIEFYFENIMLPDSVNNEALSHGFVTYKIKPNEDLELNTQLFNTANIYFDSNDPIITNTTWHTIYDCDLYESAFTNDSGVLIANDGVYFQWFYEGTPIDGAINQIHLASEIGNYSLQVTNSIGCTYQTEEQYIGTIGIENIITTTSTLYPNPTSGPLTLSIDRRFSNAIVLIRDDKGSMVYNLGSFSQHEIVLDEIEIVSGLYFLEIYDRSNNLLETLKFIIE